MNANNTVVLTGRLTRDPQLRSVKGDKAVTTLGLAVRRPGKDAEGNPHVDYIEVTAWERLAETCQRYLTKGRLITVLGRVVPERWETAQGAKRRSLAVHASDIQFLDSPRTAGQAEGEPGELERLAA